MRAWNLGMDDAGFTEAALEEADRLLQILLRAGYVAFDEEASTWWFTDSGVKRAEELDARA